MPLAIAGNGPSGYFLTKSLRFRSSASTYLNRTPASATNRTTWTWSGWVKRGKFGGYQTLFSAGTSSNTEITFHTSSDTYGIDFGVYSGSYLGRKLTSAVYRDPSAWYHVVAVYDSTNATAGNRMRLYVNGSQITAFAVSTDPSQNTAADVNNTVAHNIANNPAAGSYYLDGYLAEVNFVDGQALTPSSFGSYNAITGVWQPAQYTGTYGTNGFYLPFTNTTSTTTLGYDFSGNGNNWTTNNISLTAGSTYDSMTDVPTLTSTTAANYCVMTPLNWYGSPQTITNAGLTVQTLTATTTFSYGSIAFPSTGKWYFEFTPVASSNAENAFFSGIAANSPVGSYVVYYASGEKYVDGTGSAYGASYTLNDVIGVAVDTTSGTVTFYKNNVSQGAISYSFAGKTMYPSMADGSSSSNATYALNFGQQGFTYTPPTGYVALNTYNLPDSTIVAGNEYMDAVLWTGTDTASARTITGLNFQPDFVWAKIRNNTFRHELFDSVRGVGKNLASNSTDAEDTNNQYGYLSAFNSDGFSSLPGVNDNARFNYTSGTFVAWNWQAGQGTNTTNNDGARTSTVSVNQTAGFSVVTYTGNGATGGTIGHGLGVTPAFIVVKNRTNTYNWVVYHTSTGVNQYAYLSTTDPFATISNVWAVSSSTFSPWANASAGNNAPGDPYVAYCWAPISGYSSFGSYTGNGSTDGPFIYTGFRPKYVMIKATQTVDYGHWVIKDTSRNTYNAATSNLYANFAYAEDNEATEYIDILSNGFKIRGTVDGINGSAKVYIYIAFAENPFKNALAR